MRSCNFAALCSSSCSRLRETSCPCAIGNACLACSLRFCQSSRLPVAWNAFNSVSVFASTAAAFSFSARRVSRLLDSIFNSSANLSISDVYSDWLFDFSCCCCCCERISISSSFDRVRRDCRSGGSGFAAKKVSA